MKEIIIHTQKELDNLDKNFKEFTFIEIRAEEIINVRKAWDNSKVTASGNSTVTAWDNSKVTAYGNSKVTAYDNSMIKASGNSIVTAYDNSKVKASGNSTVTAYDSSTVTAYDSSKVTAYDNSKVTACLKSVVRLYSGKLKAYDNVTVYNHFSGEFEKEGSVNVIDSFIDPSFEEWLSRGIVYADGIYKELKDTRVQGDITVYTVEDGYVVKRGNIFSHGETVSKATEDLRFKLSDRDKSEFEDWSLDDVKSTDEIIQAYRVITGACEQGTKDFCSRVQLKDEYKLSEIVEMVNGHFGHEEFKEFLNE